MSYGYSKNKAEVIVRKEIRELVPALRNKKLGKFTLGVVRMYAEDELNDSMVLTKLNSTIKLMISSMEDYNKDLNGLSAEELIQEFERLKFHVIEKQKDIINSMRLNNNSYKIVKINDFKESQNYSRYFNVDNRWCITESEEQFDNYTCDGTNQLYFCLKNGFEKIKPVAGEGCPLDEYGLSMLSVIVDPEGNPAFCTCRWNHSNGGNDDMMNAVEISEVVGVNYFTTFLPNATWNDTMNTIKKGHEDNLNLEDLYDYVKPLTEDIFIVGTRKRYTIIDENGENLIGDKWYNGIWQMGSALKVMKGNNFNFINYDGEELSDVDFNEILTVDDSIFSTNDKVFKVRKGNKWNLFSLDKGLISKVWFDDIMKMTSNTYIVQHNGKYNTIDLNGDITSSEWFNNF